MPEAVVFTIIAFAVSWLCWLPLVAATRQVWFISPTDAPLLILLGTFGPLFGAVAAAVWLVMAQAIGFATGGYLAGRLRGPAYDSATG